MFELTSGAEIYSPRAYTYFDFVMHLRLFHSLPYNLMVLATSIAAKTKYNRKYGLNYRKHYRFLMEHDISEQKHEAEIRLSEFLAYAARKVPFYRSCLSNDCEVKNSPIIDKSLVLKKHKELKCEKPFFVGRSSGTSGQGIRVPYSKDVYQKEYAFWWYHRSFGGVQKGNRIATFAGHEIANVNRKDPPFWVFNATENQMFFSSYHLCEPNMIHYIRELNRLKPDFIHGYPSTIYYLARYINEYDIVLTFHPKMIVTSSETTLDFQRAAIEKAFGCKVFVWYGNTELCGHITECNMGRLHVQPYHSFVRVVKNDNSEAAPGEIGRIVATNFSNYAFPLVNYDMKDVVKVSIDQECVCGKGGLVVDYILGRIDDYVVTPEGRYVGRLGHVFMETQDVRNGQIIQHDPNSIIVRIEKGPGYCLKSERSILAKARTALGQDMTVVFDYDNPIEKEANGKYRFIVQNQKLAVQGSRAGLQKNGQKDALQ